MHNKAKFLSRSFTDVKPDGYAFFKIRPQWMIFHQKRTMGRSRRMRGRTKPVIKRLRIKTHRPGNNSGLMMPTLSLSAAAHFGIIKRGENYPVISA